MFASLNEFGPLVLRLSLAAIFLYHGYGKLFGQPGLKGFAAWLASLRVPLPMLMAWAVALVEFGGGVALAFGLFTRVVALLLVVDMLVAILTVHLPKGFSASQGGIEFPLSVMAGSLALVFSGAGAFALGSFGLPL
jgi:putative oxidoreductase